MRAAAASLPECSSSRLKGEKESCGASKEKGQPKKKSRERGIAALGLLGPPRSGKAKPRKPDSFQRYAAGGGSARVSAGSLDLVVF